MNENPGAKVFLFLGLFVLASAGTGCMKKDRAASGEPAPAAVAASTPGQSPAADGRPAGRHALLEIHAQLEVDVQDVAHTKAIAARLADYTKSHSGYVADSRDDGVTTHMVLRLPPADLRGARAELRGDGSIVRESEQAIDVTDAISDVDARLRSARVEETRILKLLEEKSGSITDVLAAERALADVRQRVERLEADQRLAQGRVDLATLDVTMRHPAEAAAESPIGERLGDAAKDGVTGLKVVTMGLLTTALRGGPTLLLFAAIGSAIFLAVRRLRKVARSV